MVDVFRTKNEYGEGEVRSWASLLDYNCRLQAEAISRVPIMDGYLALMPDAHHGFGPPVGSALITVDAVMPYAVGVDIGCGMMAVLTNIQRSELAGTEKEILKGIERVIPSHAHERPLPQFDEFIANAGWPLCVDELRSNLKDTAATQFGTLGGGNHFVELSRDHHRDKVAMVLHSGSRGVGNQIGTHYVKIAKQECEARGVPLESKDFAWLQRGTDSYDAYLHDMMWAQNYAFWQREAMMDQFVAVIGGHVDRDFISDQRVNCHHNYAEELGPGKWLTRKGAIDASVGKLGIIPGSMGTDTYIVRGRGNAEAYNTSPHGAGRLMARGVAKQKLDVELFKLQMEEAGRTWLDDRPEALLDEAPDAYKPIEVVIRDSRELIEQVSRLSAFINYKGA